MILDPKKIKSNTVSTLSPSLSHEVIREIDGETVETVSDLFFWAPKSQQMVIAAMTLKDAYSLEGKL